MVEIYERLLLYLHALLFSPDRYYDFGPDMSLKLLKIGSLLAVVCVAKLIIICSKLLISLS